MATGSVARSSRLIVTALISLLIAACTSSAAQATHVPTVVGPEPSTVVSVPLRSPGWPQFGVPTPAVEPGPQPTPAAIAGSHPGPILASWPLPRSALAPRAGFALRVPILMYHRIVPSALAGDSLADLVVSPGLFAAQLAALRAAGWHSVTVAMVAEALTHDRPLPPRTFAISIDDGWADGVTYALPILLHYGDVATFYVIAGRLQDSRFLSPADLRVLAADGMEIGDHTLDHVDLTGLSPAALQVQVMGAAAAIAAAVGERPATLAYPFGRFDPAVESALQRDGFALALTTQPGWYEDRADQFDVPRMRVGPSLGPSALVAELSGS